MDTEETSTIQLDDYQVGIPLYEDEGRPSATYTINLEEEGAYGTYRHRVYARSDFGGSSFDGRITGTPGFALPVVAGNRPGKVDAFCDGATARDPNGDCKLDANDALIYYYAWALRGELGNGR